MIYILAGTIRPKMFKETLSHWLSKSKNPHDIKIKIAVNTLEQRQELSEFEDVIVTNQTWIGTVYSSYLLIKSLDCNSDDIIVFISDDFYVANDNWDEFLINRLKGECKAYFANDGYQTPSRNDIRASITMPILTYSCLLKLNKVLYSLDYYHYFADTELWFNLKELDLLIDERDSDGMLFEHRHYVLGKRPQDDFDVAYNKCVESDRENFNRRMQLPVEERIKDVKGKWEQWIKQS